ncbi:MAG: DNA primase [Ruminococcus sp.]|nr:DNA primase [Ruminococcus sp.]
MQLPEEFIYQLKSTNSIDSTIGRYINLIKRGKDFVGLCPFHSEKTPSFHIYTDTQSFYCFGCGAGGDVITFTKRIENLDYVEAVKLLAQRGGLEMPESKGYDKTAELKKRILEINRETANYYYRQLVSGNDKRGLKYFFDRKLKPETIKKYGLGYAPASWDGLSKHLSSLGYTENEMIAANVRTISKNNKHIFDTFRERVIFPIIDLRGNIIAFGGRALGDGIPKYLNTGDTPVFKKSRNLFSMNFAKNSPVKKIILAEGYMDVIAINQAGFENVVATLGTALTPEQARLLKQYADEVVISYDSDDAGQKATARAINLLGEVGINTRIIKIENAKDPDEYIKKFGAQRFKMLIDNSDGAINFELEKCKYGLDLNTETDKVAFLKNAVKVLSAISNRLERDVYISKVARENEINADILRSQIDSEIKRKINTDKKKEWQAIRSKSNFTDPIIPEAVRFPKEVKAEEGILSYLFRYPDKTEYVSKSITPDFFVTEFHKRVYEVFCSKMKENVNFSMSIFANEFNDEEMGKITGIEVKNREIILTEQNLKDYMEILIAKNNRPDQITSDDDLINIIKAKKRK